mgnify:CR=1 FL=1
MTDEEKIEELKFALERIVNWVDLPDCYTPGEMQELALKALESIQK